jgi:hypothetical protein
MLRKLCIIVGLASLVALPAMAAENMLAGKSFKGMMGEEKEKKGETNEVVFGKDGSFESKRCEKFGFKPGNYKMGGDGDDFTAEYSNADGDTMKWTGEVKGEKLKARATIWSKAGMPGKVFWFKGTLVSEKKAKK